jgi:hypothetical protein
MMLKGNGSSRDHWFAWMQNVRHLYLPEQGTRRDGIFATIVMNTRKGAREM